MNLTKEEQNNLKVALDNVASYAWQAEHHARYGGHSNRLDRCYHWINVVRDIIAGNDFWEAIPKHTTETTVWVRNSLDEKEVKRTFDDYKDGYIWTRTSIQVDDEWTEEIAKWKYGTLGY